MAQFKQITSIANRLREAMYIRDKKQIDLVRETGINRSAISRYLSGEYEPKNKPIYELARALDVSEQWLMGYDVSMERSQEQKNNDAFNDIVKRLQTDPEFFSAVEALNTIDAAPADIVPDSIRKLVDFARSVPEDKAAMILRVMQSILEAD